MRIYFQGNRVHQLIASHGHGVEFPNVLRVQGRMAYRAPELEGDNGRRGEFYVPSARYVMEAGLYEAQTIPNPFGYKDTTFVAVRGVTPDGIVLGSCLKALTQWAGDGWDEYEIKVYDDNGNHMAYDNGDGDPTFFTMAEQHRRIADGTINSNIMIARHQARLAGSPQATEYQG